MQIYDNNNIPHDYVIKIIPQKIFTFAMNFLS